VVSSWDVAREKREDKRASTHDRFREEEWPNETHQECMNGGGRSVYKGEWNKVTIISGYVANRGSKALCVWASD